MRKSLIISLFIAFCFVSYAQTKSALFLGNSYTNSYNTAQIVADLAASVDDTLKFETNTPGGCTFEQHTTNSTSLEKIAQGKWDHVILQEQSQLPSFPLEQVIVNVFPYAKQLDSLIKLANPCAETNFFMTWGRKNGDESNCSWWPPVCTYQGMDSLLNLRYRMMADSNNAVISPVGELWHYIRDNYPNIELYSQDESHPSAAGSYAAACCFYTTIFKDDPSLLTFNYNILPIYASIIRDATKVVVYDSLEKWHIGEYDHSVGFDYEPAGTWEIQFLNESENETNRIWDVGFSTDTSANPIFTFPGWGNYPITLHSYNDCDTLSLTQEIVIIYPGIEETSEDIISFYPNPASKQIHFNKKADQSISFQIFDLSAKCIFEKENYKGETIDIGFLNNGIYYIKFGSQNIVQKMIIN